MKDQVCLIQSVKAVMPGFCSNITIKEFDTGHWIMQEASDQVNEALEGFFTTLT